MNKKQIIVGIITAILCGGAAAFAGLAYPICATIAITTLTAYWWVSEALPIAATSLVPFALFPLCGVLTHREAAAALGSHVIILLMASFMLSKALEKSNAHERLALYMINLTGKSGRRLIFGFMLAAATLSMWISNSATTLMLSTMALAIIARASDNKLATPLLLAIAYAASFGGTATLIGTPPNLIFADAYQHATGRDITFVEFMRIGVPIVCIGVPIIGLWLTRNLGQVSVPELPKPGQWQIAEKRTLIVFAIAITAWVTRSEPFGGWSQWFGLPTAGDSTVAVAAVVLMFLVPDGKGSALLDWKTANNIPWGMLLLFAGGICIASAFRQSGLADLMAANLTGLTTIPPLLMIMLLCLSVSFLTEMTSNTATANLLMPVLAAVSTGAGIDPALLMIPAVISCSCAFMLPVATAPNAIIYSTGRIPIKTMAREGAMLNVLIAIIAGIGAYTLITLYS